MEDDGLAKEIEAELRKALGSIDPAEAVASDKRVIDNFVDEKKADFNAFQNDLFRLVVAERTAKIPCPQKELNQRQPATRS